MLRRIPLKACLAPLIVFFVFAGWAADQAFGFWTGSNASGSGAVGAATLEAGAATTAVKDGSDVIVTWSSSSLSNGIAAEGYLVKRYDDETGSPDEVGAGCMGTITTLTCTESDPPPGTWSYAVTPVFGSSWRGSEGPMSAPVAFGPPTLSLSRTTFGGPSAPLPSIADGSVSGFGPGEDIAFFLDADTEPLEGSPSSVDSAGDALVSINLPAGIADGQHLVTVRSAVREASVEILVDSTAPTGGSIAVDNLDEGAGGPYASTLNLSLAFAKGTDPVSGLADGTGADDVAAVLQRATSTLDAGDGLGGGTCGTYSEFVDLGEADPASPFADTVPENDACYAYRYLVSDHAGNIATYSSGDIKVQATTPVDLGDSAAFAVLGGTTVTSAGVSHLTGDLGVSPGTAITGFPPGSLTGTMHNGDPAASAAQADVGLAYADALGRTPVPVSASLGGGTFTRGVYGAATFSLAGDLTLDGQGDPDSVFIFQAGSTLNTAASSQVILVNGAQACNVFWQVGSSATLGASSAFSGSIIAWTSISVGSTVSLAGRLLAHNGAVTLIEDTIGVPGCE